jgi:hypothetical protein
MVSDGYDDYITENPVKARWMLPALTAVVLIAAIALYMQWRKPHTPADAVCVEVSGIWQGTLLFQSSIGGVQYLPLMVTDRKTGISANATTVNGVWLVPTFFTKQAATLRVQFQDDKNAGSANVRLDKCTTIDAGVK